ncbi:hypothetical protein SAMN05661091_5691 [Paenibacillus uliginis N3/975]|uniref:Pectate lyase superfamily protein n=1 Tax=Paenibacillus uliginis N3/975 TaxID=1313296 RepID=A0A1X7HTC7_9BACL|nr:hypothetical protein [Paenibacillus uliginis]SMF92128.1 hypothetical protein SAMN05661091_5691 [Paenibacillus uliginis N3/975]
MNSIPDKVYVENFPRNITEKDDTQRIQRAIDYAKNQVLGSNSIGGSAYYSNAIPVVFKATQYITSSPIKIYKGIYLESEGQTYLVANPSDKSIDCINATAQATQFRAENISFIGYNTALYLTTGNVDISNIQLKGLYFHMCNVGVDTGSFAASRSTILTMTSCRSWKTSVVVKNYCDMASMNDCWITHDGSDGAAIYNDGFLNIRGGVFVSLPPQSGANPRWIDCYESSGQHSGLFIDGARFGGEGGGGYPIVYNFMPPVLNLANNEGNVISIQNSLLSSASGPRDSNIILFNLPNRISIKNCFGFTDLLNGIVSCAPSFNPDLLSYSPYISIEFDDSVYQALGIKRFDTRLERFFSSGNRRFRRTFGLSERQLIPTTSINGKAMITIDIEQLNGNKLEQQRQLGFAMLVITTAPGSSSNMGYKCISTALVTCVGGNDGSGVVKRLNYIVKDSIPGGQSFSETCDITSVYWGTGETGSVDQAQSSTNTKITIVFNCPGSLAAAGVTFTPLLGLGL